MPRPSTSSILVHVEDADDVWLPWARKVAKKCEQKRPKTKKSGKGKSTRELIKENEEMKNEELKYLKLRSSTIKIIKTEHHISNLETYIDQGIIPKGLVLKASPLTSGEKSNRFFHRWNNILYNSSFSLMDLLRQEAIHQVNYLYKLRDNLHCRSREQLSDPELDEIQVRLGDINHHFNERLKEILVGKVTSDTAVKIYDEWGQNGYDQSVSAQAYIGPEVTAKTIASLYDKSERDTIQLLDIGAGTGLVGEQLRKYGFSKIDALEPASGMLASARQKNLYRNYYNHYLKKDTLIDANGFYDCVCTCGCLAPGHIPVDSLHDFLRFAKKGGNIVMTMKKQYDVPGYSESMRSLIKDFENSGKWEKKLESQFPNYFEDAIVIYQISTSLTLLIVLGTTIMKISIVSSIICLVIAVDLTFAVPTAHRQKRWDWFSRARELYNNARDHISDAVDTAGDVADTIGVHAREHLNLAADHLEDLGVPRERIDETGERLNNITSQVVQRGQDIIENGKNGLSRVAEHAMKKAMETIENNRDFLENSHKHISRVADSMADIFGNFRDLVNNRRNQQEPSSNHRLTLITDDDVKVIH
ncbi:unnamed protein product [Mytilus edulis]|uniref:Methyltransferase type 11 domain-containing protein n=1 Tax=Mytilus edulis TaxID=6550 RepID=A0A8S3PQ77_MYTED|nr:unnamed protein product [Mytilus edulis]